MHQRKADRWTYWKQAMRRWMAGAIFLPLGLSLAGQPLTCDGAFYLTTVSGSGSQLHRIERNPETRVIRSEEIPLSEPSTRLTCLGLSVQDMYLYALDFNTYELLRIDRAGRITRLGIPEKLDTQNYDYFAGEVGPGGGSLTVIAREKGTGLDKALYNISLTGPRYVANPLTIISENGVALTDLATDPTTGIRYGFDKIGKRIVVLNGGSITTYKHQNLPVMVSSLFFDRKGDLYGYGDPGGGSNYTELFYLNKNTGKEEGLWQGPSGGETDGCSCPFTVTFTRTVTPAVVLPCSEILIEYRITNYTGVGRLSTVFEDELPAPFTISSVEPGSTSIFIMRSGPGSSKLELENLEIVIRDNVLRVRARVGETPPASYATQAFITRWPKGLGDLVSDNPSTPQVGDPNPIVIGDPEELEVEPVIFYTCARDTAYVQLPVQAGRYQWSDGSTGPVFAVDQPGRYWVEAGNDCWVIRDTFQVTQPPPPVLVDLGEDRRIRINEEINLSYVSSAGAGASYAWTVSGGGTLSCVDCPRPMLRATSDAVVTLTLTDAQGCTATDSVALGVDVVRKVYRPNAFSPDDDGVNDRFYLQGRDGAVRYLRIFNRWGALVYESRDGTVGDERHGWDGMIRGRPAEPGVYLYSALVEFSDGVQDAFSGALTLLRKQ